MLSNLPVNRHLLTAPPDPELAKRTARLRALNLGDHPDSEFDALASRIADLAGFPSFAMVNFISDQGQYFSGLHSPPVSASPGRVMERDRGWCPHVVVRRKGLILDDVYDYPRFAVNPAVDEIGLRAYMGVPLIDETDTVLGTICAVATEPRPWGRHELHSLWGMADEAMQLIRRRRRLQ